MAGEGERCDGPRLSQPGRGKREVEGGIGRGREGECVGRLGPLPSSEHERLDGREGEGGDRERGGNGEGGRDDREREGGGGR